MTTKNPIKFLDSYTKDDSDIFFGRDKESKALYEKVNQAKVVLLYGLSGTGKTSLIQCGLENKYDPSRQTFLYIRKGKNIIDSIRNEAEEHADSMIHPRSTPREALETVYFDYLTPMIIVFDQFEELFISGTQAEKEEFIKAISEILQSKMKLKVIFSLREEYLALLDEFEESIPSLFDYRLRVEKMRRSTLEEVIIHIAEKAEISIENDNIPALIIDNISDQKGYVELPYLQVYLDKLSRLAINSDGESVFTKALVAQAGKLEDVLGDFLDEQVKLIAEKTSNRKFVESVLKQMITAEGTKKQLFIDDFILPDKTKLHEVLEYLDQSRIIKLEDGIYELSHDSLAHKIAEKRNSDELQLAEVGLMIKTGIKNFNTAKSLLDKKQLQFINPFLTKMQLTGEEEKLIEESKAEQLKSEKQAIRRRRIVNISGASVTLVIIVALIIVVVQLRKTDVALEEANRQKERAENLINAFYFYNDSLALAYNDGKYGFINKNADTVVDYKYDELYPFNAMGITMGKIGDHNYLLDAHNASQVSENLLFNEISLRTVKSKPQAFRVRKSLPDNKIPIELLIKSKQLKYLILPENKISYLSDSIGKLWQLKYLDLSQNNIFEIPASIGLLTQLEYLDLSNNKHQDFKMRAPLDIPASLENLINLAHLNLSYCRLDTFPMGIRNLSQLEILNLSANSIKNLPAYIGNLKKLKVLNLGRNKIQYLPTSFYELSNLEYLDLMSNPLKTISDSIWDLKKLTDINLSNTNLKELPEGIGKLIQLENLNLYRCKLKTLPDSIAFLTKLRTLDVSSNKLTSLPKGIGNLDTLMLLDISRNKIDSLPSSICNLSELTNLVLYSNPIKSLPENIGNLRKLTVLKLNRTKLTELPKSIGQLDNLEDLSIEGNKIYELPPSIGKLSKLRILSIKDSTLYKLPAEIGELSHLVDLSLECSDLSELPPEIGNLKKLNSLTIKSENIKELPEQIGELKELTYLKISCPAVTSIPEEFFQLKELKKFIIEANLSNKEKINLKEKWGKGVFRFQIQRN